MIYFFGFLFLITKVYDYFFCLLFIKSDIFIIPKYLKSDIVVRPKHLEPNMIVIVIIIITTCVKHV
jgi:hypothetical protein